MVTTQPKNVYDDMFLSTRNEYLEFKVAACRDTRIGLFEEISPSSTSVFYEVGLGSSDNTQILLFDSKTGRSTYSLSYKVSASSRLRFKGYPSKYRLVVQNHLLDL